MEIRASTNEISRILIAAAEGDIDHLIQVPDSQLTTARCSQGCTALHWAAGANQVILLQYLLETRKLFHVDIQASKKSSGRTALHYSCRNGFLDAARWLVEVAGADVNAKAKHGVTPFQLAVWQNQLSICQWLVGTHGVKPCQVNDFACGAVHWLGTCPMTRANSSGTSTGNDDKNDDIGEDGQELLPMAKWLAEQPGVDFRLSQSQGHTPLHKAAWGGHLALIKYLRDTHGLWDDSRDDAGNYAADLADMANTPKHARIALYLRQRCSRARAESCASLGIPVNASHLEIRKAYLELARRSHPDKKQQLGQAISTACKTIELDDIDIDFHAIQKAYNHLMVKDGIGKQLNPAHSLNLMLQVTGAPTSNSPPTEDEEKGDEDNSDSFFKARLVAVLLEYGDRGLELSNVKKKWKQVWPNTNFPAYDKGPNNSKRGAFLVFLSEKAGDVVEIVREDSGLVRVFPKACSRASVAEAAGC
jgi:Ankyrin repeats (3 copies)/DnaJ domain/Ankyrin repeats (many copies)